VKEQALICADFQDLEALGGSTELFHDRLMKKASALHSQRKHKKEKPMLMISLMDPCKINILVKKS